MITAVVTSSGILICDLFPNEMPKESNDLTLPGTDMF